MEGEIRKKRLKRLCIFYYRAERWAAHYVKIEWIVCKKCQRKIYKMGKLPYIASLTEPC